MDSIPLALEFHKPTPSKVLDFGRIIEEASPRAILNPKTTEEISLLLKTISSSSIYNNLTVAARGGGHSTHGQAQAPDGYIIDMTSLPGSIRIDKAEMGHDEKAYSFADVSGGALWVEVLEETLKHGLSPRSWTDYLYLSVGGTLSVGGISGQAFKHGPQICNVLEIDVVTGKGEIVTCSKAANSELFYGVLGGLGQFGIITRARIILEKAPKLVKWVRLYYDDFNRFTEDQELLISMEEVDYVEGFIKLIDHSVDHPSTHLPTHLSLDDQEANSRRKLIRYSIEMAIYYDDEIAIEQIFQRIMSQLRFHSSRTPNLDVSYFNFLNRVRPEEQKLREKGLWEVPHPWLNVLVPKFSINQFKDLLLQTISSTPINGPILIYPMLRHKWNTKMSVVLPPDVRGENIFYAVSLLHTVSPSCMHGDASDLHAILQQNQKIIEIAASKAKANNGDVHGMMNGGDGGLGGKQYLPYCKDEREWRDHFGEEWERFKALKSKFDPFNVLTPGQRIFKRKNVQV